MMRVTNSMLSYNFLKDMRNNLNNMQTMQEQLTSGKEIRKPSDNPFKVSRAMQLHSDIDANKQYNENIKDTINWLDATDTALGQAGNVLQRVRELLVSSGNAAYGSSERKAIKDEINQKVGELSQIINTNFDGKYVFGGTRATSKPMDTQKNVDGNTELIYRLREGGKLEDTNSDEYKMIESKMKVEISQGVYMEYNVSATEITNFKNEKGDTIDLKSLLGDIVKDLDAPDGKDNLTGKDLQGVTDAINNLLKVRAEVGAKQNRMDSAKDKNIDENFNMTEILSSTEDINFAEKMMQYSTMQTVYMASLQTSAKIIQPSLLDFLR